jgi:CheY-like chemotaxis protein
VSIPPTLLVADDSLTIQRVVSLTFADQPVRVVVAKDGQDAINRMMKDRPDLVLADTNMPCVDGYELARWVRQQPHLSAVPVLLLAGVTDPVDEQRLYDSGANGVLEKPFEPSHVISRVKELLGIKGAPPAAATRLVTTPDMKPARTVAPARSPGAAADRPEAPAPPHEPGDAPHAPPIARSTGSGIFRAVDPVAGTPPPSRAEPAAGGDADRSSVGSDRGVGGDAADWLAGYDPRGATDSASLAEELGVSGPRFYGQAEDVPVAGGLHRDFASERAGLAGGPEEGARRGRSPSSSPADVFESLLAAEQADSTTPVVIRSAPPELTAEMLDDLAARVVERLRPNMLRDELQRGLALGLRETVSEIVRDCVATETRAAVAGAVQTVNGAILGTVRGAVNEAVCAAVPTAVAHELRQAVAPLVEQTVREIVGAAVRDAVAAAVPQAVLEAVRGDSGRQVSEIVHDTAERLIREEIARIRERR